MIKKEKNKMRTIIAIATFLAASWASAQEFSQTAPLTELRLVPAVKKTASIAGVKYTVARDENNKIVFVKTEVEEKFISPILIQVEEK